MEMEVMGGGDGWEWRGWVDRMGGSDGFVGVWPEDGGGGEGEARWAMGGGGWEGLCAHRGICV